MEAELLDLTKLCLVRLFVTLTKLLNDLKDKRADRVILIIQTRNEVREKLTLMIFGVRQARQEISDCSIEAFSHRYAPVSHKTGEVVEFS